MWSARTREQDFMAITAEVEVLCQQLKGRGMYPIPSTPSTTNSAKPGGSVHFQPIDPAQKSSVQAMDQSLLNSSLNLLDDSPQTQSSSKDRTTSHEQAMPRIPAHGRNYPVPPTPYVNQTAPEGTTHSASTQDERGYDGCPDPKTGTITPIAGQHTTSVTTFCRCATGTSYRPTS